MGAGLTTPFPSGALPSELGRGPQAIGSFDYAADEDSKAVKQCRSSGHMFGC